MLQQTQVGTVIPYFRRFMEDFPTVRTLAQAGLDRILQHWAGLGYYIRARNLHQAARRIVAEHNGAIPADVGALIQLPGIGRSTAGAILSLAFDQPAPILDGNVKRLWCRLGGIADAPGAAGTERRLWALSEYYLPDQRNADYTQALMDFGATICTRTRPRCPECPLQPHCRAHQTGRAAQLPVSRPRRAKPIRRSYWLLLRDRHGRFFLEQHPPTGIWAGLWVFPHWELREELEDHCRRLPLPPQHLRWLPERRHALTHCMLRYTPALAQIAESATLVQDRPSRWLAPNDVSSLAMPTPVRHLLTGLMV